MTMAREFSVDTLRPPAAPGTGVASWYAPGPSDELGDRLLMFDNTGGASLELLRFRRVLSDTPGFEEALHTRVSRLRDFHHPSFATVRSLQWLSADEGLALISDHTAGKRISEVLQHARGPGLAAGVIRQLAPALAALEGFGDGVGHGALSPSRIVIRPKGHLVVVEQAVGSALTALRLTPDVLGREFGISVPRVNGGTRASGSRTDCFQLALVALSVLVGRPIAATAGDSPQQLAQLLDTEVQCLRGGASGAAWLHGWLRRALQLDDRAFESSADALQAFREMAGVAGVLTAVEGEALGAEPILLLPDEAAIAHDTGDAPQEDTRSETKELEDPILTRTEEREAPDVIDLDARLWLRQLSRQHGAKIESDAGTTAAPAVRPQTRRPWLRLMVASLLVVAGAEAIFIARLMRQRPAAPVPASSEAWDAPAADHVIDNQPPIVPPAAPGIASRRPADAEGGPQTTTSKRGAASTSSASAERSAAPQAAVIPPSRPIAAAGGIRFDSPIALDIYEGNRRLGSTATGIVPAAAGRRQLDLVNSVLGFKMRQTVDIPPNKVVSVAVRPPNGVVNINAVPWAHVWIDGKSVGETPLGRVSVPLGEREIRFQHPELGEQRKTVTVRLDETTRVTANLRR